MDDNQNLDGFDPLEVWMNQLSQQHLTSMHPSLSTPPVYHQSPGVQTMREYVNPLTLPPAAFSSEGTMPLMGQSTFTLSSPAAPQQYSQSLSSRQSHHEHFAAAAPERSAWSHLLALDPTISSFGSPIARTQESYLSMHNKFSQLETPLVQKREDPVLLLKSSSGSGSQITEPSDRSLPRIQFVSGTSSSLSAPQTKYSVSNSAENKASQQLNQLMNLSKKVAQANRSTTSRPLTICTNVPSLESSGGYSPVSPPAVDIDEQLETNSGKVAELLLREPLDISSSSYTLTSDQSDIFNYISQKVDGYSNDPNSEDSILFSKPSQRSAPSAMLPSPSDLPLDMTTAIGPKTDKPWQEPLSKVSSPLSVRETTTSTLTAGGSSSSASSSANEQTPLLQTLLSKKPVLPGDPSNETDASIPLAEPKQQNQRLFIAIQDKQFKPMKNTPKKSNFYGRDASLFSFSQPSENNTEQNLGNQFPDTAVNNSKESVTESSNLVTVKNSVIDRSDKSLQENNNGDEFPFLNSTLVLSGMNSFPIVSNSANHVGFPKSSTSSTPSVSICNNSLTAPTFNPNLTETFHAESGGSLSIEEKVVGDSPKEIKTEPECEIVGNDDHLCDSLTSCKENDVSNNASHLIKESTESSPDHQKQTTDDLISYSEDHTFVAQVAPGKGKVSKRKKRRPTGFKAKPRKKVIKKQKGAKPTNANPESYVETDIQDSLDHEGVEEKADVVPHMHDVENGSNSNNVEIHQPSRKRLVVRTKTATTDPIPRRSSSRKSKDNAMRLIELQADSNYNGISDSIDIDSLVNKKQPRKRKKQNSFKAIKEEVRDLAEDKGDSLDDDNYDDGSDEKDGDYVIDEEEAQVLDIDAKLEEQIESKRKPKEKKLGGLKISIKLSGNSSAEIVSGIDGSPVKKKKKMGKKKVSKKKEKGIAHVQDLEDHKLEGVSEHPKLEEPSIDLIAASSSLTGDKSEDRHMSLMEKYFSAANAAHQFQKNTGSSKSSQIKKKMKDKIDDAKHRQVKGKTVKTVTEGNKKFSPPGQRQKVSVKFSLDKPDEKANSDKVDIKDSTENDVPKFVCGYCPQKYYNKNELRAHMEDHMVEMERKNNTELQESGESKKAAVKSVNSVASRDPRSNRTTDLAPKTSSADSLKHKPNTELTKESNVKVATIPIKQVFPCGECGQVFNSKPSLLDHVRIHTAEKPFECDICHKCFTERNLLSAHRKTHGQEKLLRCHMCSKAFVHKADLDFHVQSHPKRSVPSLLGKQVLITKKPLKRYGSETHEKDNSLTSKKPKSFASALSGDKEIVGKNKDAPFVLVLKRDVTVSESKNSSGSVVKTVTSEPRVSLKPITLAVSKPDIAAKTSDNVKKPTETAEASSKVKSEDIKEKMSLKVDKTIESTSEKVSLEFSSSNICTCKECPECVTRFLQSFE